jgi:hypothetical protein
MALLAVAVVVVGWIAMSVISALVGIVWYLIMGSLVIAGGYWLYRRARRAMEPGTRARRRLEAAARTRRLRDR